MHITAPSRASDDARYRALASAYLAFEPARVVEMPREESTESSQGRPDALVSPQASFRSVWDNVNSPSLPIGKRQPGSQSGVPPHPHVASQIGNGTQASWLAPPSEVPDSMPYNDISVPAFCTPTRVLNYYLQATEPVEHDSDEVMPGGSVVQTPSSPTRHSKVGLVTVTSSLPEADILLGGKQASWLSRVVVDGSTIIPSTQVCERAESEPPSAKRPRRGPAEQVAQPLARSISDVLPRGANQGSQLQQTLPGQEEGQEENAVLENADWSHVTQIISAEPLVANRSLGPRPPVNLERLAEDMEMQRRYKPSYQAREMRPYERGYWLVKLDGWGHNEKVAFWGFLGNWIHRDGNAGWGTRACRDESWHWVRLYGWEHIVGELYILLYVASYRLLKCMEMKFYDGAGNVLVIVGARSSQRNLC